MKPFVEIINEWIFSFANGLHGCSNVINGFEVEELSEEYNSIVSELDKTTEKKIDYQKFKHFLFKDNINRNSSDPIQFLEKQILNSPKEKQKILSYFGIVLELGEFTSGNYVSELEHILSVFYEGRHLISCNSGTTALSVALKSIGVSLNDKVIIPANSFSATENSILAIGAKPVFVDVNESFNLDPVKVERAITEGVKAIVPVHLYGKYADIESLKEIADRFNIFLVEDACQAFGLSKIGEFSDAAALSFNPYKNIGFCGKAGAILCNSSSLAHKIRAMLYHGFSPNKKNVKELQWGLNAQIDNTQAAIGVSKLSFFTLNTVKRAVLAFEYCRGLKAISKSAKSLLTPKFDFKNTWHLFPLRFINSSIRDEVKKSFSKILILKLMFIIQSYHITSQLLKLF
jgi:3-dehydro-glucose-6-phosphate--glutamate transaminase